MLDGGGVSCGKRFTACTIRAATHVRPASETRHGDCNSPGMEFVPATPRRDGHAGPKEEDMFVEGPPLAEIEELEQTLEREIVQRTSGRILSSVSS